MVVQATSRTLHLAKEKVYSHETTVTTTILLSSSVNLTPLATSHKWDHIAFIFLSGLIHLA